ncbi:ABC transporter ATP-binding protein [Blautia marasmi]|uniref:ABC transporter ATP-binding protein n=1 Tax=Blautia marasmi TaxID=1917868 RepID=UPI00266D5CBD|nr:ABC transporter ATP-binding protein [Blautia marasmi]
MEKREVIIHCSNLKKIYNKGKINQFKALSEVSFTVYQGEIVAITGKSGSGKSTLLHILGCLDRYDEGEYLLNGRKIWNLRDGEMARIRNEHIGIVMQNFALVEEFTAFDNVLLPLDFSRKRMDGKKARALKALEMVDMKEYANQKTQTLSGGQKQRVAIARSIINSPDILLADEPTGALDTQTTGEIIELFLRLKKNGMTVIIVTHDPLVAACCQRIIQLQDGKITEKAR